MCNSNLTKVPMLALILLLLTISIHADVPQVINYQGRLTDSGGNPVADGSYQVVFTIYDAATAGNSKWTETQSITTSNGLFTVLLGTVNPIIDTVFIGATRYLSLEVAGDPELIPRTALVSVPYTQRVSTIDGASGGNITSKLSIGPGHTLSGDSAGIGGGYNNVASGEGSSVGGGGNNSAVGQNASVAGGQNNHATGYCSSVGGGSDNTASNNYSTVAGGTNNSVTNGYSNIAGGIQNSISGNYSAILGGFADTITSNYSYLFGINANLAQDSTFRVDMPHIQFGSAASSYEFPTVDGTSGQVLATDGSGQIDWTDPEGASGWTDDGTVVRLDSESDSVGIGTTTPTAKLDVIGDMVLSGKATFGPSNTNTGINSFVLGKSNNASGENATISGGWLNTASGDFQSTVSGGAQNTSSHTAATVGGGQTNTASGLYSTVSGGFSNTANGSSATVSGGYQNAASGDYSFTVGYADSISASGDYSVLFGIESKLTQDSTFMVDMPHVRIGNETDGFELPTTDGTSGQVMTTDGAGQVSWSAPATGDSNWTESGGVLYTTEVCGIARLNSTVWGSNNDSTHINLGVHSTTGEFGFDYKYITVSGGYQNIASGELATIGGGANNSAGDSATVSGGYNNTASGNLATVSGGRTNLANGTRATISGGSNNHASGQLPTVGGGYGNYALDSATIGGGSDNTADGAGATISGGCFNEASGYYATVGGGLTDTASGDHSTIAGGLYNIASDSYATICGGFTNIARGNSATVSGGYNNSADSAYSTVSGGFTNRAGENSTTVSGGYNNSADSAYSTVSGGFDNIASGQSSTVSGGNSNTASGLRSTVSGGYTNTATGPRSSVVGGLYNDADGAAATVCGGYQNDAAGDFSFAAGHRAKANHEGSFVWGDATSLELTSSSPNEFTARASGGFRFYTHFNNLSGAILYPGSGTWASVSGSTVKENIRPVDGDELLKKIAQLDITRWNYKSQDASIEHIGPMAQDFHRLFGVGENNTTISTVDPDGISLAAIKALIERNEKLEFELAELRTLIEELIAIQE